MIQSFIPMAYKSIKEWPEDERPRDRLEKAGETLGIKMLDHIIVADGRYTSLLEKGYMVGK